MEETPVTKISAGMNTKLNLGNFENVGFELRVDDFVRSTDSSTQAAVDRVFGLVETKLMEKVEAYNDRRAN